MTSRLLATVLLPACLVSLAACDRAGQHPEPEGTQGTVDAEEMDRIAADIAARLRSDGDFTRFDGGYSTTFGASGLKFRAVCADCDPQPVITSIEKAVWTSEIDELPALSISVIREDTGQWVNERYSFPDDERAFTEKYGERPADE